MSASGTSRHFAAARGERKHDDIDLDLVCGDEVLAERLESDYLEIGTG